MNSKGKATGDIYIKCWDMDVNGSALSSRETRDLSASSHHRKINLPVS